MVKFKTNEIKKVGAVQISAKKLRDLADKLKETRQTEALAHRGWRLLAARRQQHLGRNAYPTVTIRSSIL